MPFPEVPGGVAMLLEHASERGGLRIEPLGAAATLVVSPVIEKGMDAPALRILPGRQRTPRRRADGRVHVKLLEANAFRREAINVWRLRVLVSKAGEVSPAHVINEDHDDVWLRRVKRRAKGEEEEDKSSKHVHETQRGQPHCTGICVMPYFSAGTGGRCRAIMEWKFPRL